MGRRVVAGFYWAVLAVMVVVGQVTSVVSDGFKDHFVYFTNQSNIFLGVIAAWSAWALLTSRPEPGAVLRASSAVYITITGLVYNLVLAGDSHPVGLALFSNKVDHIVTPIMGVLGWLVFQRHGTLRLRHSAIWLCYPLAYFAFALIRGLVITYGSLRYPYPFLDVVKHGYAGVLQNAVMYAAFFWVLGLAFMGVDRLLPARQAVLAESSS